MVALTFVVTGSTEGIGYQTALELGRRGAGVLVHGRNRAKAERAVEALRMAAKAGTFEPVAGDLSSLDEVRALAAEVRSRCDRLDGLINNAGVMMPKRVLTGDGLETTFQVNHLAAFLLTRELLPLLIRSAPARIVTVTSQLYSGGTFAEGIATAEPFSGMRAYSDSKLANVLFTLELAARLDAKQVTANCLHPGVIGTKLLRAFGMSGGASLESGARTSVWVATAPELAGVSGKYFSDCREVPISSAVKDPKAQRALWQLSERLVSSAT